ncbi:hypothetical protein [Chondromyces crocatus]|uniref:Secreted protein n=1 Tax=Chondromyces crocatus TaxID=52 RepID=A0A0K1EQH6_CHOCO|nr:hypothetical protein [Chondromyces crocatus]AKT43086.1 uncharacterized protein CMC5_073140 [Chondromyces crocatus]
MKTTSLTAKVAALLSAAVCLPSCAEMGAVQEEILSERGGFTESEVRLASIDEVDYCAAEVLRLRYDAAFDLLRVADARAMLNCCGRRTLKAERLGGPIGGSVEITLRDEPEPGVGRCETECAFDAAVGVLAAPSSPVSVRVVRDVVDAPGGPRVVWQGEIDPAATPQAVVVDNRRAAATCGATSP